MQPESIPESCGGALRQGAARLARGPHPGRARRDAETLLLHLLGTGKAWLLAHAEAPLPGEPARRYAELLERRLRGEPIQYITGEAEFYGLPFRVTPDVLIPRPETEHLVEKAIAMARSFAAPRIVDVGTGSGAIAVTLAHALTQTAARQGDSKGDSRDPSKKGTGFSPYILQTEFERALAPEESLTGFSSATPAKITAIDLSAPALALAGENAARNGVAAQIRFLAGDLLAPVAGEAFELVVSNPPYVPAADRATLAVEVREYEPALALFAGEDGLEVYRRLIPVSFDALAPGGFLALEIGCGQQQAVAALLARSGFEAVEFLPDLQGIPRVACARRA